MRISVNISFFSGVLLVDDIYTEWYSSDVHKYDREDGSIRITKSRQLIIKMPFLKRVLMIYLITYSTKDSEK